MTFSRKQLKVLSFPFKEYDALICDGAIRSGKTTLMTVAYVDDAMRRYNHRRFIIGGKTVKSATRNVIEPYIAMTYSRGKYDITWKPGDSRLIVRKGNTENYFDVFGGKDKSAYQLVQGFTAAGCLIDEVALCDRDFVYQCMARCSVDGSRFWFNCNPESPMHWFKLEWVDKAEERNALHLHFKLKDNPSLSDDIIRRYESQYTGVFRQRYIEGEWVNAEGLVYPFERDAYVIDEREAEQVVDGKKGRWYVSVDYGITNPFAALLWYVTLDTAYLVDEYRFDSRKEGRQLTNSELLDGMKRLVGERPVVEAVVDPSASSFKQEMYRDGRFFYRNADNDVIDGIATTAQMLSEGAIKVSERCEGTISEMGLYRWDDEKDRDAVIKENDHCLSGDTLIDTDDGQVAIRDLVGKSGMVWSYDGEEVVLKPFHDVRMTRKSAMVYEIATDDNRKIRCTDDHLILVCLSSESFKLWVRCDGLVPNVKIASIDGAYGATIKSINPIGFEPVYNMEVDDTHCFATDGLIVHNCMDAMRYMAYTVLVDELKGYA